MPIQKNGLLSLPPTSALLPRLSHRQKIRIQRQQLSGNGLPLLLKMEKVLSLKLQSTGLLPVQVQKTQILATGSARELELPQTVRKLQLPGTLITLRELGQMEEIPLPKTPSVVPAHPTTLKLKTKSKTIPTGS